MSLKSPAANAGYELYEQLIPTQQTNRQVIVSKGECLRRDLILSQDSLCGSHSKVLLHRHAGIFG